MSSATDVFSRPRVAVSDLVLKISGIAIVVGGVFWLIANLVEAPRQFFEVVLIGLNLGALYALIALGYTLVYGIIELINFAHGDLFMLGTVLTANLLVTKMGFSEPSVGAFFGLLLTLVVVMAFCALVNTGAEFLAYRRLRRAPRLAPLITAVGLSFIFQNIALTGPFGLSILHNGSTPKQWPSIFGQSGFDIGGVRVRYALLISLATTAVLLLMLTYIVQRTRWGKAMRATAQDQDGARLMGVNVNATISFTFALGGAMAGAAAILWVQTVGSTRYEAGFILGLIAFTAAVMGGIGNLVGAVLGGLIIGLIQACNEGLPYGLGQEWSNTVVFSILILLMVFRPQGLLGATTTEKV